MRALCGLRSEPVSYTHLDVYKRQVLYEGESAYYSPANDSIHMPSFSKFKSGSAFYSVLGHERAHWSGAPTRLNRDLTGRFGDAKYAMEELIAEISSAMLCAHLQLSLEPRADHAPYLQNWLKVLRNDCLLYTSRCV